MTSYQLQSKTLRNMQQATTVVGIVYADTVSTRLFSSPNFGDGVLQDITIQNGTLENVVLGLQTPNNANFNDVNFGSMVHPARVTFQGNGLGETVIFDGPNNQFLVNVPALFEQLQSGNLAVQNNSLFAVNTGGGVQIAIAGETLVPSSGTITLAGPVVQSTETGNVAFNMLHALSSSYLRLDSINDLDTRSRLDTLLQTNYGRIELQTRTPLSLDVLMAVSVAGICTVHLDGHADPSPTYGMTAGDRVHIEGTATALDGIWRVLNVPSETQLLLEVSSNFASLTVHATGTLRRVNDSDQQRIFLNSPAVSMPLESKLYLDDGAFQNYMTANASSVFEIHGNNGIALNTDNYVRIPDNTPLQFGTSGSHYISGDGNQLTISSGTIALAGTLNVPFPKQLTFGSGNTTYLTATSDMAGLTMTACVLDLAATSRIAIPANVPLWFGTGSSIEGTAASGMTVQSTALTLKNQTPLVFPGGGTIQSPSDALVVIDTPNLLVTGNLTVRGAVTSVETVNLVVFDPVITLGEHVNDGADRGLAFKYSTSGTTGFMGFRQSSGRFALYSDVMFGATNWIQSGTLALLETEGLFNTSDLLLTSPSVTVPLNTYVWFDGARRGVGLVCPDEETLVLTGSKLKLGSGGTVLLDSAQNRLTISATRVDLAGSALRFATGDVTVSVDSGSNFTWSGLQSLNIPSETPFRFGTAAFVESMDADDNLKIRGQYYVVIEPELRVMGPITSGTWNGSPVTPAYGGLGNAVWTVPGAIPYYTSQNFMESAQFTWNDAGGGVLQVGTARYSPTRIEYGPGGSFTLAPLIVKDATWVGIGFTDPNDVLETLHVNGNILLTGTRALKWGSDEFLGKTDLDDLVMGARGRFMVNAAQGIGTDLPSLNVHTTLALKDSEVLRWMSSHSSSYLSYEAPSDSVHVVAGGQLFLTPGDSIVVPNDVGVFWGSGTPVVGIQGSAMTGELKLYGSTVSIPQGSQLSFTASHSSFICATSGGGDLVMSDDTVIRIKAPLVIIDGDLQLVGTTSTVSSQSVIVDGSILHIGEAVIQTIVSISDLGTGAVLVETALPHGASVGDTVTVDQSNCIPSINGSHVVQSVLSPLELVIHVTSALTQTGNEGVLRAKLNYDPSKDVGLQLHYYDQGAAKNAYVLWQDTTQRFVFVKNGINVDNKDVITVLERAPLEAASLIVGSIGAFSLTGPLSAGSQLVSGSHFDIAGGSVENVSLDNWTTSGTSVITNLNADYLRGKTVTDFVLRDGSQGLTADWATGPYTITAGNFAAEELDSTGIVYIDPTSHTFRSSPTHLRFSANALQGNVDVSGHILTLAANQIDGSKVAGLSPNLSIGGNAESVTDGLYVTDFARDHTILKADAANQPTDLRVDEGTLVGRLPGGTVAALSILQVRDMLSVAEVGLTPFESIQGGSPTLTAPLTFVTAAAEGTVNEGALPLGQPGQMKIVMVYLAGPNVTYRLSLKLTSADGHTGLRTLTFDRSGQSVQLVFFPGIDSWMIVNSGAFIS